MLILAQDPLSAAELHSQAGSTSAADAAALSWPPGVEQLGAPGLSKGTSAPLPTWTRTQHQYTSRGLVSASAPALFSLDIDSSWESAAAFGVTATSGPVELLGVAADGIPQTSAAPEPLLSAAATSMPTLHAADPTNTSSLPVLNPLNHSVDAPSVPAASTPAPSLPCPALGPSLGQALPQPPHMLSSIDMVLDHMGSMAGTGHGLGMGEVLAFYRGLWGDVRMSVLRCAGRVCVQRAGWVGLIFEGEQCVDHAIGPHIGR